MEPRVFHWPFSLFYSSLTRFMGPGYRDLAKRMKVADDAEDLLDIGGGDGRLAIELAKLNSGLKRIVTVDKSKDMTRRARRRIHAAGAALRIFAEREDMHALSYRDGRFDVVVSFGALHHAIHPEVVLREAYRMLRPGGQMWVIDGHDRPSFEDIRRAVRGFGGSFVEAAAYWCGSKDCLSTQQLSSLVPCRDLPGIELSFDGVLAIVYGTRTKEFEPGPAPNGGDWVKGIGGPTEYPPSVS